MLDFIGGQVFALPALAILDPDRRAPFSEGGSPPAITSNTLFCFMNLLFDRHGAKKGAVKEELIGQRSETLWRP